MPIEGKALRPRVMYIDKAAACGVTSRVGNGG